MNWARSVTAVTEVDDFIRAADVDPRRVGAGLRRQPAEGGVAVSDAAARSGQFRVVPDVPSPAPAAIRG